MKRGAAAAGALILGSVATSGTVAADIGDGRLLDFHLNNVNYDRDKGTIVASHVHDASPYKNHGVWNGNTDDPVVNDGAVGNAFAFVGDNTASPQRGEWIDVSATLLDGATQATAAGWFKGTTLSTAGGIFGHRLNLNGAGGGLTFRALTGAFAEFLYPGESYPDGAIELLVNGWGGGPNVTIPFNDDDGTWHHLAGVYDGQVVRVYLDGSPIGATPSYSSPLEPLGHFEVGRYKWDDQGDEWYFSGVVDEVRVYDRALSGVEIQDLVDMRDTV